MLPERLCLHTAAGRQVPFDPPERITVRHAFRRYTDIDIYDSLSRSGHLDTKVLPNKLVILCGTLGRI